MRNPKINYSKAFSLIEMIGVLAIIGILASVVAPKVFDAIRDAKITAAVGVLQTIKSSCTDYARKYNLFPEDGNKIWVGTTYRRPYGDNATDPAQAATNFADLLVSEGILEKLVLPIGPSGTTAWSTALIDLTEPADPYGTASGVFSNTGVDYPVVCCRPYRSLSTGSRIFASAQNSTRVVFLVIPGLTILEAVGIKTKVDGPFAEDINGAPDILARTIARDATGRSADAINNGNCRLVNGGGPSGGTDAFLYVAHE